MWKAPVYNMCTYIYYMYVLTKVQSVMKANATTILYIQQSYLSVTNQLIHTTILLKTFWGLVKHLQKGTQHGNTVNTCTHNHSSRQRWLFHHIYTTLCLHNTKHVYHHQEHQSRCDQWVRPEPQQTLTEITENNKAKTILLLRSLLLVFVIK